MTIRERYNRVLQGAVAGVLQGACMAIGIVAAEYVAMGDFEVTCPALLALWWTTKLGGMAAIYGCCRGYRAQEEMKEERGRRDER